MGSTATDDATKPAAGKAAKRQGKHPSAPAKTTATENDNAATDESATDKPAAGASKKTLIEKIAGQDPAADADPAAATASDPRSLAWMSAQAVSALNAVREHQAEQARELLARVEKPPARHTLASDTSVEPTAPTAPEATAPGTTAATAAPPPPARDSHEPDTEAGATAAAAAPATGQANAESIHSGAAAPLQEMTPSPPPAAVRKSRPLQPALLAAVLVVTGLLIYWSWPDTNDAVAPAATQESLTGMDEASIVEVPRAEVISVVPAKPAVPAAAPAGKETVTPAMEPALPEPQATPPLPATVKSADPVSATQQQDKTVPAEAAVPVNPAPPSPGENGTGQASVQPAAPVAPATTPRSRAPQPRYQAPAYGQYPQQPGWQQQPYYRPAYPQYPSR